MSNDILAWNWLATLLRDVSQLAQRTKNDLWLHDLLSIMKGFRNGLIYGIKIRLPHALVMTFLFRPEP